MTTAPALSTQHSAPTRKLRLPAFGKALLAARRQGQHPSVVHVIYGEDWRAGERCEEADCLSLIEALQHPRLAVRPADFAPWTLDWHCVTGCLVAVFDRRPIRDQVRGVGAKNFYTLLGEIGRFAGPVHVYRVDLHVLGAADTDPCRFAVTASVIAADLHEKYGAWPAWWPVETERLNAKRRERWFCTAKNEEQGALIE